jgi:acetaldehyde dehydrogenase (acetylating)
VVVDRAVADEVKRQFIEQGAHFLSAADADRLAASFGHAPTTAQSEVRGQDRESSLPNKVGIAVPATTRVLIAELRGVGRDFPLSIEKLCPVLS